MDTDDAKVGAAVKKDLANLRWVVQETFRGMESRYSISELSGAKAAPTEVRKVFQQLKVGPKDTLFFFYSGHGGTDPKRGHFFSLGSRGYLYRSEVRSLLAAAKPRQAILLSDCCSDIIAISGDTSSELPENLGSDQGPKVNTKLMRRLLLNSGGVVDMTSSKKGTSSYCNDKVGGFFCSALCSACCDKSDCGTTMLMISSRDWDDFCKIIASRTRKFEKSQEAELFELEMK
jgi:hypothetical protein